MLETLAVLVGLPSVDVSVIKTRSPDFGVIVGYELIVAIV